MDYGNVDKLLVIFNRNLWKTHKTNLYNSTQLFEIAAAMLVVSNTQAQDSTEKQLAQHFHKCDANFSVLRNVTIQGKLLGNPKTAPTQFCSCRQV